MRFAGRLSSPGAAPSTPHRRGAGVALAAVCAALAGPAPAAARLAQADLARVAAAPPPGAQVPLDLALTDAAAGEATTLGRALGGRPALLLPVDYTCANVCDPMVSMSADALAATGLPARDYALVLVGLDPRDDAAAARRMLAGILGPRAGEARPLVATGPALARLTGALGYTAVYDPGTDGFAHPAAAMLLAGDGRVARVLSPLALNGRDLRLALTEAGEGRVGGLADRLILLCYGYDAETGAYTPLIRRILTVAAAATVAAIALLVFGLSRFSRTRSG